ncbi:MAG TPA: acylphosphatase [Acidimicrobiaceae bacterium]|nr:acylphosphatase [Acidimicrobiaceae bacterium]
MSDDERAAVVRRRVVVAGRVHGVGFRASCARRAQVLGVAGSVSNRPDGTVEAVFEGEAEAVDAMVGWSRHGPPMAQVTSVDVYEEDPAGLRRFAVV